VLLAIYLRSIDGVLASIGEDCRSETRLWQGGYHFNNAVTRLQSLTEKVSNLRYADEGKRMLVQHPVLVGIQRERNPIIHPKVRAFRDIGLAELIEALKLLVSACNELLEAPRRRRRS
jgi:hypothetical protein